MLLTKLKKVLSIDTKPEITYPLQIREKGKLINLDKLEEQISSCSVCNNAEVIFPNRERVVHNHYHDNRKVVINTVNNYFLDRNHNDDIDYYSCLEVSNEDDNKLILKIMPFIKSA